MRRTSIWLTGAVAIVLATSGCGDGGGPLAARASSSTTERAIATPGHWALDQGLCARLDLPSLLETAKQHYDVTPNRTGQPVVAEYHRQQSGGERATARCTLRTPDLQLQIILTTSENDDVLQAAYRVEQLSHEVSHFHGRGGYYAQSITTPQPASAWWRRRTDAVYNVAMVSPAGSRSLRTTLATTLRSYDMVAYVGVKATAEPTDRAADQDASRSLSGVVDHLVAELPTSVETGPAGS